MVTTERQQSAGITGTDERGRQVVFVAGPKPNMFAKPEVLLEHAVSLAEGAEQVSGPAATAMRARSEVLFSAAVKVATKREAYAEEVPDFMK